MILILLVGLAVTTSWVLLWLDYRSSDPSVAERLLAHAELLGYWQETLPWVPSPTDWTYPLPTGGIKEGHGYLIVFEDNLK